MHASEADALGALAASLAASGDTRGAVALLSAETTRRNAFAMLDRAGRGLGAVSLVRLDPVRDGLARTGAEGAWPVIGSALGAHLRDDPDGVLARCRGLIRGAGVWYATDILAERVPGPALVDDLGTAAAKLSPWRHDEDRWVRRAVGVAVHYWAKRAAGEASGAERVLFLLEFVRPMLGERNIDAAKGVGWALKTLGRHRPAVLEGWLRGVTVDGAERPSSLVLRKAVTYLPEPAREDLLAQWEGTRLSEADGLAKTHASRAMKKPAGQLAVRRKRLAPLGKGISKAKRRLSP